MLSQLPIDIVAHVLTLSGSFASLGAVARACKGSARRCGSKPYIDLRLLVVNTTERASRITIEQERKEQRNEHIC
jgi:hypothetical protein